MKRLGLVWLLLLGLLCAQAQNDSATVADTSLAPLPQPKPVTPRVVKQDTTQRRDTTTIYIETGALQETLTGDSAHTPLFEKPIDTIAPKPLQFTLLGDSSLYNAQPFFEFKNPQLRLQEARAWKGKEALFYATIALLIFFAVVRNNFARYASDLFSLFLRTTIKQKQLKEQLLQAPLPSLLLNIVFFISGALFINLLLEHYGLGQQFPFWMLFLYAFAGLVAMYLIKFFTLKLVGWMFRIGDVTDAYTFIVFTTNKVIGMLLLPFIILLAFSGGPFQQGLFNLSLVLIAALFIYRFYLSFATIERQLKISLFHFLIYFVGFEIIPLLLINKLLFRFLGETL